MMKAYTTKKLDEFFRSHLDLEGFIGMDDCLNGIQVDNDGAEIKKIAFAVDASMEAFKQAAAIGAGMVFVHHGMLWGGVPLRLQDGFRERVKFLLDNNIAFYAVHLPLDQHPTLGNNAVLAELLGMKNPEPFGSPKYPKKIGYKGKLAKPLTIEEAAKRIAFMGRPPLAMLSFGKAKNLTCAVCSGGAAYEARQAIEEGIDLYVSGEAGHGVYHQAKEAGINIIAGGHYLTEVWGVLKMMELCKKKLGIGVEFLDIPTGL
jgi:dinuclear metal center YbgI/SA1388 family protein